MNDLDELLRRLITFLSRLERGEYQHSEERAFEELNILCQNEEVRNYLTTEYFPELLVNSKARFSHMCYLVASTLQYSVPSLGSALAVSLIAKYAQAPNEEILKLIVDLILNYKLFFMLSIENDGRSIRFESKDIGFTVRTELVRSELRLALLRISLIKYSKFLAESGPPNPQEIQAIVLRLNTIIKLISRFEPAELNRYTSLLPLSLADNISFRSSNSHSFFARDLSPLEYDELIFEHFKIPLLPIINKDKVSFDGQRMQFHNEGLGALPPFSITLVVNETEFELGEYSGNVKAESVKNVYIDDPSAFTEFLKNHSPNSDIKINFAFKKFNRSYEYSVLAESVGDWLQKMPLQSVELALPFEAPLDLLSSKEFERLCFWIVEEYKSDSGDSRFRDVVWLGEDGGGEQGRDVIAVEEKTGEDFVFQCKRIEKFGPSDIEKELKSFQQHINNHPEIKPDVYILFTSTGISAETKRRGDLMAQEIGMKIGYWGKSKIDRLIRTNKTVRERFWTALGRNRE